MTSRVRSGLLHEARPGWSTNDSPEYTEFQQAGGSVAGLMAPPPGAPSGFWLAYFAADDPAAKAEQATSLGGTILVPAQEFPGGTFAVVQDPHSATFGLLRLSA